MDKKTNKTDKLADEKTGKKRKWKKVLIILLSVLLVLGVAGYFLYDVAMYYIGDTVLREIARNEIINAVESGSITDEDLLAMAEGKYGLPAERDAETTETTAPEDVEALENGEPSSEGEPSKQEKKPATSEKPKLTSEERNSLVNKATNNVADFVSREDKIAMARLITSRLSSSDISYLAKLLQGGLTRDERTSAYRLAVKRFQGEELEQVSSFYHKYKAQIMSEPDLVKK